MHQLSRTVRFTVPFAAAEQPSSPLHNTFAGWPASRGLGAYYELTVRCGGVPDERTGYVEDIAAIDDAVRSRALPAIREASHRPDVTPPAIVLRNVFDAIAGSVTARVRSISWQLTPTYSVTMNAQSRDDVEIAQQFEFSAAHRLHCAGLSDEENRRLFGKCNNPEGHGHNYRLEVAVAVPIDEGSPPGVIDIDRVVDEVVIQRFDHRHLNRDTAEFASLNPSVEHITRVCYDLLRPALAAAGGDLRRVTVWETGKTSCTYPVGA
jgi:6-pyruvoyltetrahydropterin/6-carboxytetrahydropterin synthase